jgi:LacI family transcriptional regulator
MLKKVTLKDIARVSGFSKKTVSRVVNNDKAVSAATRENVGRVIEQYGYRPNYFAQNLRRKTSNTIGLIVHNITNPFIPQFIERIEQEISGTSYSILLSISDIDTRTRQQCIQNILDKMVDGLILTNVDRTNYEDLRSLQRNQFPFVLVLNKLPDYDGNFVGVDNLYGSELMMNYLHALGFRKIGFIAGLQDNVASIERLTGYRTFLVEHGLAYDESLVETGNFRYEGGYEAFARLVEKHRDVEAVFCVNDYTALGALDAARHFGLRVPEDITIVGFDDTPIASYLNIWLTTIRIPISQIAKNALQILMEQIEDRTKECRRVILKPELVIR